MKNIAKADLDKNRLVSHDKYCLPEYDYLLPKFHFLKSFWTTDMSKFTRIFFRHVNTQVELLILLKHCGPSKFREIIFVSP